MVLPLLDSLLNWNSEGLVFDERGILEYLEKKNSLSKGEKQQQTLLTFGIDAGI